MRLLITGGAGFIGSNFVRHWLGKHPADRIVVLDALTYAGNLSSLGSALEHPSLSFIRGDICDAALVQSLLRDQCLDTIVHFAAESHVDRSISDSGVFIQTNVSGTHTLLEAVRKVWLQERAVEQHRFHHVSTDEVYGSLGEADPAFTEKTPYAPNSPYAASKAASDHLVRAYHHTYGLSTTISNCSNNYGPYHFPEKLIPLMIVNILSGRPLPIYGDGANVRDWLHVSDHCRAIELILSRGSAGAVYNVGGRAESKNLDLVRLLCAVADEFFREQPELLAHYPQCPAVRGQSTATLIQFVKDRPGHDRRYAIDCGRIETELGFKRSLVLETGLRDTFSWYVANEKWWRGVMDGSYQRWIDVQYRRENDGLQTHRE
jgi:dTDP-glucose 4,6-dehydratase